MATRGFNPNNMLFHRAVAKAGVAVRGFNQAVVAKFAHLFTNKTTTVGDTRYLVNQGEGANAVMHTGQGVYSNGNDNSLLISGYIAQYIHWKDGVFTVTEINANVTDYNLIANSGIYQWALLTNTALTATELNNIKQNPELALYWNNGVLTSDYFDIAKVFEWYPMTENVSAGGYYRNHALPAPINLISDDFNDFTLTTWVIDGDSISIDTTLGWQKARYDLPKPLVGGDYLFDIEITSLTAGELSIGMVKSGNGYESITPKLTFTIAGSYKIYATIPEGVLALYTECRDPGATGTVKTLKAYPLANSGYSPLTNWTKTTSTNAQQLATGYQCALQELDSFGLPTGKPDGLLHGDGRGYIEGSVALPEVYELDLYWFNDNANGTGVALMVDRMFTQIAGWAGNRIMWALDDANRLESYGQAEEYHILTVVIDKTLNTVKVYKNNNLIIDASDVSFVAETGLLKLLSGYNRNVGNVQITNGIRTDEQRATNVTNLMNKYGVTA